MWVGDWQPLGGAPWEVASVSPGQVGPVHCASDGVHGLFSVQQRKAGAQRQQEEQAGQEGKAYHLLQRKERKKLQAAVWAVHTCQQYLPGPGQPSERKPVAHLSPTCEQREEASLRCGDQAFIFLAGAGADYTN